MTTNEKLLEEILEGVKVDFDNLFDDLKKYIDLKVEEEIKRQLALQAEKFVSQSEVPQATPTVQRTMVEKPMANAAQVIPETPSVPVEQFAAAAPRRVMPSRRPIASNSSAPSDNFVDDFFPNQDEPSKMETPSSVAFTPSFNSRQQSLSANISFDNGFKAEPVVSASPQSFADPDSSVAPAEYADFVQKYNLSGSRPFSIKLSIMADIADELSYKCSFSDWQELSENYIKNIVLENNYNTTVRYVAEVSGNNIKRYFIAPQVSYHPNETEIVQMALLAFFEYNPDNSLPKLRLSKPAIFEKQGDGVFVCVEKGILE